jgi:hypothetical protein
MDDAADQEDSSFLDVLAATMSNSRRMADQDAPMRTTPNKRSFPSPTSAAAQGVFPLALGIASPVRLDCSSSIPSSPINRASDGECADASLSHLGQDADSSNRDVCIDSSVTSLNKSDARHPLCYISESQPRLGSISAQLWDNSSLDGDATFPLEHRLDGDNSQMLIILYHQARTSYLLPCQAMAHQEGQSVIRTLDHWQIKVQMATSLQREPNGASVPLSSSILQKQLPSAFLCNVCLSVVAETDTITRYLPLPSQHWEELIDAWMCHSDQEINQGMIDTQKKLDEHRGLQRGQGRVSDAVVVLHPSHLAKGAAVKNDSANVSVDSSLDSPDLIRRLAPSLVSPTGAPERADSSRASPRRRRVSIDTTSPIVKFILPQNICSLKRSTEARSLARGTFRLTPFSFALS